MSFQYTKFNKVPKIIKQLEQVQAKTKKYRSQNSVETKQSKVNVTQCEQETKSDNKQFDFQIKRMLSTDSDPEVKKEYNRVQTSAFCLTYSKEWQELADAVKKEIIDDYSGTSWKDCIGLEKPQQLLKESVIYPVMYPHLFTGLTRPWKGILLYGPPGTGKTHLAKAVACESNTTFINLTSSTFVSKWRGESEKMIKVLFDLARLEAPTTIFIDEIDAVFCQGNGSNQDASRRFRCELLIQMDGLLQGNESIFVLASTNKPWDLDAALLRRFEKRILINLPNQENRYELFKYFLKNCAHSIDEEVLKKAAEMTGSFSGSDLKLVCKEACMKSIRSALKKIEISETFSKKTEVSGPSIEDIFNAIQTTNPLTDKQLLNKYLEWNKRFGSC
ncbi:katanin p60 ATPase-containing subunit A-like 2 isoform X2 [Agrilus planipennis]|nr:katanin p60 ATPase-containing subunit A-like 2 isoform X2 [Agrilus planipennis]